VIDRRRKLKDSCEPTVGNFMNHMLPRTDRLPLPPTGEEILGRRREFSVRFSVGERSPLRNCFPMSLTEKNEQSIKHFDAPSL
jgi:hypothetical protein